MNRIRFQSKKIIGRVGRRLPIIKAAFDRIDEARAERDHLKSMLQASTSKVERLSIEQAAANARIEEMVATLHSSTLRASEELSQAAAARDQAIADKDGALSDIVKLLAWAQAPAEEVELKCDRSNPGEIPERVPFRCNICGAYNIVPRDLIGNEISSCRSCHSSVRFRSIVHLVSMVVYGKSLALSEFTQNQRIRGIGLSDWIRYADPLSKLFDYQNTYYHQEPKLDIVSPPAEMQGTLDFLISSEVFEHIPAPVSLAFEGAFSLLKPGGHFIFSVPYRLDGKTVEHYPDAVDFRIVEFDGKYSVITKDKRDALHIKSAPIFHGGDGQTLEMRVFSKSDVLSYLTNSGFIEIQLLEQSVPEFGLYFPNKWSLPILARKPSPS